VGWFDGAEPLDTATFRDTWEALKDKLKCVPKDREILTYCSMPCAPLTVRIALRA